MTSRAESLSLSGDEVRALGALVADAATGIARMSGDVHAAVADRVFGALYGAGLPVAGVRGVHDLIARESHAGARTVTGAAVRAAAASLAATRPAASATNRPAAVVLRGVLGGAWGDRLAAAGSPLAPRFALVVDDRRAVTGRLVVFVHGLGESDRSWRTRYGDALARRCGVTPVYARYNSGRAIADSADELASGLESLVVGWPLPVAELVLVGHSMGGLVIRAAGDRAATSRWAGLVATTVALGTPHEGAPLARASAAAQRELSRLPETRPFAAPLRVRSAGIRDLEHGCAAPCLPDAAHYLVAATVTHDPDAPAGRALGDLLVTHDSAWGRRGRTVRPRLADEHHRHVGGATHFDLLGHPTIAELLCEWVGAPVAPLG